MILHDKLEHYINHPLPPSSQHNVCRYSAQTSLFTLLINPGPLISAAYANIDSDPPNMHLIDSLLYTTDRDIVCVERCVKKFPLFVSVNVDREV